MPNQIPPPSPEINRLKAAAALIPIIESGLLASKLSVERAALMASFCEWTIENVPDDPEVVTLAEIAGGGLKRIKMALPLAGEEPAAIGFETGRTLSCIETACIWRKACCGKASSVPTDVVF